MTGIEQLTFHEASQKIKKLEEDNRTLRDELVRARQEVESSQETIAEKDKELKKLVENYEKLKSKTLKTTRSILEVTDTFKQHQCEAVNTLMMSVFEADEQIQSVNVAEKDESFSKSSMSTSSSPVVGSVSGRKRPEQEMSLESSQSSPKPGKIIGYILDTSSSSSQVPDASGGKRNRYEIGEYTTDSPGSYSPQMMPQPQMPSPPAYRPRPRLELPVVRTPMNMYGPRIRPDVARGRWGPNHGYVQFPGPRHYEGMAPQEAGSNSAFSGNGFNYVDRADVTRVRRINLN